MLAVPFKLNQDRRAARDLRRPAILAPGHSHGTDLADRVPPNGRLVDSIVGLLGLALRVPSHTTLSRRMAALEGPRAHHRNIAGKGRIGWQKVSYQPAKRITHRRWLPTLDEARFVTANG